jgi:hypothetical protein
MRRGTRSARETERCVSLSAPARGEGMPCRGGRGGTETDSATPVKVRTQSAASSTKNAAAAARNGGSACPAATASGAGMRHAVSQRVPASKGRRVRLVRGEGRGVST